MSPVRYCDGIERRVACCISAPSTGHNRLWRYLSPTTALKRQLSCKSRYERLFEDFLELFLEAELFFLETR